MVGCRRYGPRRMSLGHVTSFVGGQGLTDQERDVLEVSESVGVVCRRGFPFEVGRKMFVVDLFFPGMCLALECTGSVAGGSGGLRFLVERCAYLNYKFKCIGRVKTEVLLGVLAEASEVSPYYVRAEIYDVLDKADFIFTSLEEFRCFLRGWKLGLEALGKTQAEVKDAETRPT